MDYAKHWLLLLMIFLVVILIPVGASAPIEEILEIPPIGDIALVQGNSLLPIVSPITITTEREKSLLAEIFNRESNGDPKVCNAEYGCKAGMGLAGFIPNTWNSTIDRMIEAEAFLPEKCQEKISLPVNENRTEAVFDPECNEIVADWLLKEDGIIHWDEWSGPYDLSIYTIQP